jgi:hypothetical protein
MLNVNLPQLTFSVAKFSAHQGASGGLECCALYVRTCKGGLCALGQARNMGNLRFSLTPTATDPKIVLVRDALSWFPPPQNVRERKRKFLPGLRQLLSIQEAVTATSIINARERQAQNRRACMHSCAHAHAPLAVLHKQISC